MSVTAVAPSGEATPAIVPAAENRRPHHPSPVQILRPVILLIVVAVIGWNLYQRWTASTGQPPYSASGTVEANETTIASELTGRVREVLVQEGDPVRAGQELVRLDDTILQLQYRQAQPAEQQVLREQIDRMVVRAPRDGVVLRRSIQPGEIALAGSPLMEVADVELLDLTIYLLQRDIGSVRVGQPVIITTDSLPGERFVGTVTSINSKAEFTPRNVQTQRDRLNLVFGVKVRIASDGRLKPGMPVDARVQVE